MVHELGRSGDRNCNEDELGYEEVNEIGISYLGSGSALFLFFASIVRLDGLGVKIEIGGKGSEMGNDNLGFGKRIGCWICSNGSILCCFCHGIESVGDVVRRIWSRNNVSRG